MQADLPREMHTNYRGLLKKVMNYNDSMHDFTSRWVAAQPAVAAFIKSAVRDIQHAEDVLQEVASKSLINYERYDRSRPFVPWALGIARNEILVYYRKAKGDRLVFDETQLDAIATGYAQVHKSLPERSVALEQCVERLEDRPRNLLRLRYARGLAVKEISSQLGATPNAISRVLYKVRLALKECVERKLCLEGGTDASP